MIESPCTKICTLNARSSMCLGCGRTIDEIAGWAAMNAADRARIINQLPARLTAAKSVQANATIVKTAIG
jgi:predicted Fe-S protein YdhL (DUF1289 family)